MRKVFVLLMLLLLMSSALAVETDPGFNYEAIVKYAEGHYGEVYTIVGRVLQVEEYHRSSEDTFVEEYTKIAVDDSEDKVICLHYNRSKMLYPLQAGSYVAALAYVDGVQRIGTDIVPLLESNSSPLILNKD